MRNWKTRLAGILLVPAIAWYLPWMFANLNWSAPWLSLPFAAASITTAVMALVTTINHWRSSASKESPVPADREPAVAVIIPTYGEPSSMVYATAKSVLEQNYPRKKIKLIISDDGHRASIREVVNRLAQKFPDAFVAYNDPPRRGDPARRGEAKAGNLNSVLDAINEHAPHIKFIETRDADDTVGDPDFLRQAVGQFLANPKLAFVQTIKEAQVSDKDPFGNMEPLFYRRAMLARNAANAVFPCGSGLLWRREALVDIGGFPTWNLVEDLQSGVEALRRGWRGAYLPIVGAVGQTAPEDTANAIKQRGTWALDTMRLFFWGKRQGLSLGQRLQFAELGFFYLLSFAVLIFAATPVFALAFDIYPLITTHEAYALRFWPYAVAIELLLLSLADGLPFESLWRARQTWLGMAPVYARATLIALFYGPNRRPSYRVTRKEHVHIWYWKEILPQATLLLALLAASVYHVATHSLLTEADLGSLFWAAFFLVTLTQVVRNSWFGLRPTQAIAEWLRRPRFAVRARAIVETVNTEKWGFARRRLRARNRQGVDDDN